MNVEEVEWVVEVMKFIGKLIVVILCIGFDGDSCDVFLGECVVRFVRVGIGS